MQWGDEGKGRVVDLLSEDADLVVRYNGGDNAGHTVTVGEKIFKLHLIPSGIIHTHVIGVLGNGLVINPSTLLEEIQLLQAAGIDISPKRLWISDAAHIITPAHRLLDKAQEIALGSGQIGTTGRGIGPAYVDKASRKGIRLGDVMDPARAKDILLRHFEQANHILTTLYQAPAIDPSEMTETSLAQIKLILPYVRNTGSVLRTALKSGKRVLAEGAQGTLLDLDQGSYPFVTSSCTTATGIFSGLGIGIQAVDRIIGITKAFQTRVGSGPFPTELEGEMASYLRGTGANPWDEFGTTTGRPRRVGWLDLVLLRYAIEINGTTELFLTKMDILTGIDRIHVCSAYRHQSKMYSDLSFSGGASVLGKCDPVYEVLAGWKEDISLIREWDKLPPQVMDYIQFIEKFCEVPVSAISVGPERSAVIYRK
jgi:adenylosuccinate synthase